MENLIGAEGYHRATSYQRNAMPRGLLDWAVQPTVYKRYEGLPAVALPPIESPGEGRFDEVVSGKGRKGVGDGILGLHELGRVLALSYGVTGVSRQGGSEFHYRSAPSAGALYPCEIYVAVVTMSGLTDGLYHYQVLSHGLVRLREGDAWTAAIASRAGQTREIPQCAFFISTIFNRSAWKYRERSYRYVLLDSGHLLENVILALRSIGVRARVNLDFPDREVNALLGVDPAREGAMALIEAGGRLYPPSGRTDAGDLPPVQPEASITCHREIRYPLLQAIHGATCQPRRNAAADRSPCEVLGLKTSTRIPLGNDRPRKDPPFDEVVQRRRSRRNFITRPLPMAAWNPLLRDLGHPVSGPGPWPSDSDPLCVGFAAERLDKLEDGLYLLDSSPAQVGLVKRGRFLERSAACCLEQGWLAAASLHVYFLNNLQWSEALWGPRIYRHILITAGRLGQRLYLRATALGLGVCGIGATFDDELSALLGLNKSSIVSYVMAIGVVKKQF